ncbi:MAG TPA: chitobiase/beta-hexosaminidase C-terminal domain-containing protein, partial [Verrucomicrobiota bacterium]|nr:chitobiase/beta-hexosaminidase C-terminal domain-containing protein [Verrucomicrobiota bacterium]
MYIANRRISAWQTGKETPHIINWLIQIVLLLGAGGGIAIAQEKVADTKFSMDRGFYTMATNLTISTTTLGATIKYTLDGSDPRSSGTATSGATPVMVLIDPDSTAGKWQATPAVMVRAYAHKVGMLPTDVDTHTYIFIPKVITQGDIRPTGSYVFWNNTEMDPEVVTNTAYSGEVATALLSIPTWSIVMNHEDLFGTGGIHRGNNLTVDMEKACSLEMIYPATPRFAGFKGFQIDCGIKIQGGGGRWDEGLYDHKQSFGLRFRREYGAGTLDYPLFEHAPLNPDSATDAYDKLVLRSGHNKSWGATWDNVHTVFTRDQLARDLQIDMSGIGGHGSFVHLYLNGIYWGLYNPCERQDNAFASTYLGGNEEDYFTGKGKGGDTAGVDDRYDDWINTASKSTNIATLLEYCNIENHADMAMLAAYADVGDFPQYYYGIGNNPGGQVYFFNWDYEDAFGGGSRRSSDNPNTARLGNCAGFNNMWNNNLEYRINFADRVYRACYNEGALTDARVLERWLRLCGSIYSAIIGESARWGDERFNDVGTRNWGGNQYHDTNTVYMRDGYWMTSRAAVASGIVGRADRLVNALRSGGWYPAINPPLFKDGGTTIAVSRSVVSAGFNLTIQRDGSTGTVYYTTDGSDPRAVGGAVQGINGGTSATIPINATICVKARTLDGSNWSALHTAVFFVPQDLSALKLTEIMYNPQDTLMAAGRAITSI